MERLKMPKQFAVTVSPDAIYRLEFLGIHHDQRDIYTRPTIQDMAACLRAGRSVRLTYVLGSDKKYPVAFRVTRGNRITDLENPIALETIARIMVNRSCRESFFKAMAKQQGVVFRPESPRKYFSIRRRIRFGSGQIRRRF